MSACVTTVKAMALSDPAFASLPVKREMIFPIGEPPGNDARTWRFTAADLALVVKAFEERPDDYMAVDYAHGLDRAKGMKAAGWIDHLELASDGLYAHVRYTDEARTEINAGAWGYRSPEFDAVEDDDGAYRAIRLTKLALVNDPAIGGMPPLQAAGRRTLTATTLHAAQDGNEKEEGTMTDSKSVTAAKKEKAATFDKAGILATLRETFAMPDAVNDEMLADLVAKALSAVSDEAPAEETPPPEASIEPPPEPPPFLASRQRITLDAESEKAARAKTVDAATLRVIAAMKDRRVTPATQEAAVRVAIACPEEFDALFSTAPAPKSGQVITQKASDRKPALSWAETQTKVHQYAAAHRVSLDEARKKVVEG